MQPILEVQGLNYVYPDGTKALNGASLKVERGQKIAILGANGSGKSTLFLCINGVLKPSGGRVLLEGDPVKYDKKGLLAVRKEVGVVFQDPETQLFCMSVAEEVAFGPRNLGCSHQETEQRVQDSLNMVDAQALSQKPPHFLSYGQKKRVSVAAVLSMKPQVLLLDEPTSALDPAHTEQMNRLLDELCSQGITLILSTHDVDFAYGWADQIVVMKEGKVLRQGSPDNIFTDDRLLLQSHLSKPAVLRVYQKLCKKGILSKKEWPHTIAELEERLESC